MEKKTKTFLILITCILLIIAVALLLIDVSMKNKGIDKHSLKAAGLKELTPISSKVEVYKPIRARAADTYTGYVRFEVEIEGMTNSFWMTTEEAYGETDLNYGERAVEQKKIIKRYIYYNNENIYASENAETVDEYISSVNNHQFNSVFYLLGFIVVSGGLGLIIQAFSKTSENKV